MKNKNYHCIRCGYNTHDKSCMRRHFERKPINNIELSHDIKQTILNNRVYIIPEKRDLNNYNFLTSMDPKCKLYKTSSVRCNG